jgi:hypothetical protein
MRYYDDHELDELREIRRRRKELGIPGSFLPKDTQAMHDQRRAMAAYKDFHDYDADRDFIEHDEVIDLLQSIERHQHALREAYRTIQQWLDGSEQFAEAWCEFTESGGVSADDFVRFIAGTFRCRRVRRKKHLRLVSSSKPQRIRLRR